MSSTELTSGVPRPERPDAVPGWFVPAFATAASADRSLSIRDMLAHQWGWIFGGALVLGAALFGLSWLISPKYESSVLVAPAEDGASSNMLQAISGQVRGLASLVGVDGAGSSDLRDRALAILRSQSFTSEFVREVGAGPVLFPDRWDSATKDWRADATSPSLADIVERFDRNVRFVSEDRRTGFVRVSIRGHDPALIAEWANRLVAQLNGRMRHAALEEAGARLEFLRAEAARTDSIEVRQAVFRLMEAEYKAKMLANVRHDYAFRIIDPASVPDAARPIAPRRGLMTALGIMAGLLFGTAVAAYRESRRTKR